ncbi:MAG: hypothetical protein A2Z49_03295 [Chloroflexi bacterium RBG_19FT_COMBO_56_12]|nr:MAG: hypothetical protein A2Z49_03295 [Chloroflexi bacterium RBG_19FT_COMBO_56_12]
MKRAIHPLLLAIYPVLALLAFNITEVKPADALRALLVSLASGIVLFIVLKLVLRNTQRAALVFSTLWVLFFSYGHVYHFLDQKTLFGLSLGHHRVLIPLWLILLGAGLWWVLSKGRDLVNLTTAMNAVAIVLLVFPLLQITSAEIRAQAAWSQARQVAAADNGLQLTRGQRLPDIYYIILDAYGREDILQETFNYDNSPFLDQLEAAGFYVARCSLSNYAQTELSLSSSLNFDYLPALVEDINPSSLDRNPLFPLLKKSATRQMLEGIGYQTVAFKTGYTWIQWEDADVYLVPDSKVGGLSAFEVMLVESSAAMILNDAAAFLPKPLVPDVNFPKQNHRELILSALDKLTRLPTSVDSPKFVYAHIIAPHDPYVFDRQGNMVDISEPMDDATFQAGYRDELIYLNQRVIEVVKKIIRNSAIPPVIIIQGDHGPGRSSPGDRMKILNAYYLPGFNAQLLYPSITPVNTFRLVFDQYFGGQFGLLEDKSYYSVYESPYQFKEIPNECELTGSRAP